MAYKNARTYVCVAFSRIFCPAALNFEIFVRNRCDADPEALADYILALLKHNAPENELRKELGLQLEEFLEKGAQSLLV